VSGLARALAPLLLVFPQGDPDDRIARAAQLARIGKVDEARALCEETLAASPIHRSALLLLGELHLASGRKRDALSAFDRAAALDPRDPRPQAGRGLALHGLALDEEADRAFAEVQRLRPDDAGAARMRGFIAYDRGDLETAERRFREAIERSGEDAEARFGLALCLLGGGKSGEARAALEEVIRRDPLHLGAIFRLGTLDVREGRLEEGRARLEEHRRLARVHDRISFLRDSLRLEPENVATRVALARVYLEEGFPAPAAEEFRRVLALRPDSEEARAGLEQATRAMEREDG
jgi:tetratricopeptide (TPR) repeat protein